MVNPRISALYAHSRDSFAGNRFQIVALMVEHLKFNYKFILITISDPKCYHPLYCVHPTISVHIMVGRQVGIGITTQVCISRIKFHIIKFSQPFNLREYNNNNLLGFKLKLCKHQHLTLHFIRFVGQKDIPQTLDSLERHFSVLHFNGFQ